jgi:gliding motility-associated-like protein
VRLIAIDSTSCNIRDTAYTTIRVRTDRAILAMNIVKLPPCQDLIYRFDNLSTPPPGKPFGPDSFVWDFGDGSARVPAGTGSITHQYPAAGTYYARLVLIDTNYCNAPDSLVDTLRVSPLVKAQFTVPSPACAPFTAVFNNNSLAGETFFWDFGDGTTSTAVNPVHLYPNVGTYRIKLVVRDPNTCNVIDSTEQTINVNVKPTANFNHAPTPPEVNKPVIFTNLSTGGVRYKWLFGDGDSTVKTTMDTTLHQYNATGTYTACLITYNQYGCTDTICKTVEAQIVPLLDVPNAFTPGRFGKNSIVRVEGFGINRMIFKIYNRWGQKVFESNDRRLGWDGNFNGKPQPMEVYAYVLDVEFSDGTRTRKTGDITLIR